MVSIHTNLSRGIILYMLIVACAAIFWGVKNDFGALIILMVTILLFLNYILSKQLFRITLNSSNVTFEYLQLYKKIAVYDRKLLSVKSNTEVSFRGGKNEVFNIYNINTNKKIARVSKRQFKSESDYKSFIDLFKN